MKKRLSNNKGFSLVELIIVVAIMAILIGILAPQYIKYVEKSRVSADEDNIEEIKKACEVIAADPDVTLSGSPYVVTINHTDCQVTTDVNGELAAALSDVMGSTYTKNKLKSKTYTSGVVTLTFTKDANNNMLPSVTVATN